MTIVITTILIIIILIAFNAGDITLNGITCNSKYNIYVMSHLLMLCK
jgi:hypothetical protein